MTYEEIKAEAQRLPVVDQLRLIEEIYNVIREQLRQPGASVNDTAVVGEGIWEEERARLLADIPLDSPIRRTFGMLRTTASTPTDEEIEADYTNYLNQKYA